jgi:hypothetical protein
MSLNLVTFFEALLEMANPDIIMTSEGVETRGL